MKRKVILITGPGKSGTHLLYRLLDSQAELAVYPHEFHFLRAVKQNRKLPEIKEFLFKNVLAKRYVSGYHIIPEGENNSLHYAWTDYKFKGKFNRKLFIEKMNSIDAEDIEDLFFEFSRIYFQYWGIDIKDKAIVIKIATEVHESYQILQEHFENYKILIMRRNPKQILASRKKVNEIHRGARAAFKNGVSIRRDVSLNNPRTLHVEYERLIAQDITYFQDICNFLDITAPEKFPMPTIMGEPWSGDSTMRSGIENTSYEYKSILTPMEKIFVTIGYTKIVSSIIFKLWMLKERFLGQARS